MNPWEQEQNRLAPLVEISPAGEGYQPAPSDLIFAMDVQYQGEKAFVGLDVQHWQGEWVETFVSEEKTGAAYVPGYFSFREGPPLLSLLQKVQDKTGHKPSLLLIDGHGYAHPRRFGVACWMGIKSELPSIGCAKESLIKFSGSLEAKRGSQLAIKEGKEVVGYALRSQDGIKPVFVSAGHRISHAQAMDMVLELSSHYRISEPLRRADQAARAFARGEEGGTVL